MTQIDGIEVAIAKCDICGIKDLWIFRGQNGEGYKITCTKGHEQSNLLKELKLPYLWRHKE